MSRIELEMKKKVSNGAGRRGVDRTWRNAGLKRGDDHSCLRPEIIRTAEGMVYVSARYAADILDVTEQEIEEIEEFTHEGSYLIQQDGRYFNMSVCLHLLRG